jgi:hypothetical protein
MPPEVRLDAAKAAAPFVHPRVPAVEYSGPKGGSIEMTMEQRRERARRLIEAACGDALPEER